MTHCQVCGREIKVVGGLIAHHGYQRPWQQGRQTSSCFGARWRPYEVACDALLDLIPGLDAVWLADAEDRLWDWVNEPPETIEWQRTVRGRPVGVARQFTRPEGFTPVAGYVSPQTYEGLHHGRQQAMERKVRGMQEDLRILQRRLAEWRPVATREVS